MERLISDVAVSGGERADDGGVGSERQTIDDARRHGLVPQLLSQRALARQTSL